MNGNDFKITDIVNCPSCNKIFCSSLCPKVKNYKGYCKEFIILAPHICEFPSFLNHRCDSNSQRIARLLHRGLALKGIPVYPIILQNDKQYIKCDKECSNTKIKTYLTNILAEDPNKYCIIEVHTYNTNAFSSKLKENLAIIMSSEKSKFEQQISNLMDILLIESTPEINNIRKTAKDLNWNYVLIEFNETINRPQLHGLINNLSKYCHYI